MCFLCDNAIAMNVAAALGGYALGRLIIGESYGGPVGSVAALLIPPAIKAHHKLVVDIVEDAVEKAHQ